MKQRRVGPFNVSAIALGCMNLSHAYGAPPPAEEGEALLRKAVELGVTFFDTAALYGFGANEELVGRALEPYRSRIVLASKCGITGVNGKRVIDGRPETLKRTCEESLRRLRTDVIDLYYLHRWDKKVPIEESIGGLADLVRSGKIRAIGLSEVSADTLRRAHAVHPIAAVQSEYSLWTRNPEIAVLDACRELGAAFVAFSPTARAFLTGELTDPARQLQAKDLRLSMPRFEPENYAKNLALLPEYRRIAAEVGCTMAQLSIAWLLARNPIVVPLPGTRSPRHLEEDLASAAVELDASTVARLDALINEHSVVGARYAEATQREVDTETFPGEPYHEPKPAAA